MTCEEAAPFIEGYFDGELDLVRNLEMERHMEGCQACAHRLRGRQGLRTLLRSADLSYRAPESLRAWSKTVAVRSHPSRAGNGFAFWQGWIPAAALAAVFGIVYLGSSGITRTAAERQITQEVVSAHVRSLLASHLTDVVSTDQHTVKPWFNGRLDFSPAVRDFSDRGFPLIGGRLDYLDSRSVAAIIYRRAAHPINLFIWPSRAADSRPRAFLRQGYNVIHWNAGGMTYWAISDLNEHELKDFTELVRQ